MRMHHLKEYRQFQGGPIYGQLARKITRHLLIFPIPHHSRYRPVQQGQGTGRLAALGLND